MVAHAHTAATVSLLEPEMGMSLPADQPDQVFIVPQPATVQLVSHPETTQATALLIARIIDHHRQRQDLVRAQGRMTNHMQAIVRSIYQCAPEAAATYYRAVVADITAMQRMAEGKPPVRQRGHSQHDSQLHLASLPAGVTPAMAFAVALRRVGELYPAYQILHQPVLTHTRALEKLAVQLPVWPWADSVRGFGALGLAQIIGECGDLTGYANPAKVWKRMGLAVIDGGRQRKVTGDAAREHSYSPIRRSIMWVIGDSLLKGNRDGPFRSYYLAEKARQTVMHPEMIKMQCHLRAKRHMEKRLLLCLWRAWRDA